MRLRGIYSVLLAVAVFATAGEAVAQKFPERRTARQGTRLYEKGDYAGAETAYRRALEMSQVYADVEFETAILPNHGVRDIIQFTHPDFGTHRYVENYWEIPLEAGRPMKHKMSRAVIF